MKFKFLSNGVEINGDYDYRVVVNPAYIFLRAYYLLHGKNPNVEWLPCEWFMEQSVDEQLETIIEEKPDVIGFSIYVWNNDFQFDLIRKVKAALPNTVIVIGGPNLIAHKDDKFFEQHPYVDYVCYGDGEKALTLLLDNLAGLTNNDLVNMVENLKPGYKLWPFEIVADEKYLATSPYLIQEDFVVNIIHELQHKVKKKDPVLFQKSENRELLFTIEFARGCMYKCSFCDWSQNLTHKVRRRTSDWRKDIDFFHKHDLQIREADANFGQWPEDYEIFKYCMDLYDPKRNFCYYPRNYAKLKKDLVLKMQYEVATKLNKSVKMSLQDIHEDVLKNIDRPSIPWEKFKPMIKELHDKLPPENRKGITGELIVGLPGQTYEKMIHTAGELHRAGVKKFKSYTWSYMVNSPGAEPEYQEKFGVKWAPIYASPFVELKIDEVDEYTKKLVAEPYPPRGWLKTTTCIGHYSSDTEQILKSQFFIACFAAQMKGYHEILDDESLQWVLDEIRSHVDDVAAESHKIISDSFMKHGASIWGIAHEKKFINVYDAAQRYSNDIRLLKLL